MKKNNNFIKKVLNKEKSLKATVLSLFISIMILLSIIFGIQLIYINNSTFAHKTELFFSVNS